MSNVIQLPDRRANHPHVAGAAPDGAKRRMLERRRSLAATATNIHASPDDRGLAIAELIETAVNPDQEQVWREYALRMLEAVPAAKPQGAPTGETDFAGRRRDGAYHPAFILAVWVGGIAFGWFFWAAFVWAVRSGVAAMGMPL